MVDRFKKRFNVPAYKIGNNVPFWINELRTITWHCAKCKALQKKGSYAFELTTIKNCLSPKQLNLVHKKVAEFTNVREAKKVLLCLDCALEMCEEIKLKVELIKSKGGDAFKLFQKL